MFWQDVEVQLAQLCPKLAYQRVDLPKMFINDQETAKNPEPWPY